MWRLILCCLASVNGKCYWNNKNSYQYFGTKTPYDDVRGDFRDVPPIEGCDIISIWFITRHGTRHPNTYDAAAMKKAKTVKDEIIHSYVKGRGEMCAQDIADLQNWRWNKELDTKPSVLTKEGHDELFSYGQRFKENFLSFLVKVNVSLIRPTAEIRTRDSSNAFIEGLEDIGPLMFVDEPIVEDPVARPYRYCRRRGEDVINNTQMFYEVSRYQDTHEFKKLQANVRERSGMDYQLKPRTIMAVYDLCRFYRAYTANKRSPWCALFSDHELEILEYVEDIRHHYRNGYGHPMNRKLGAAALKDLYKTFTAAVLKGQKSFVGYFSHDTMLHMIFSTMNIYYDYPEISGLVRTKDRKWRTSFMTPFAANLVAVLHRCPKANKYSYRVQFFINEKEFHLCGDRVCSWLAFKNKFKQFSHANISFCDELVTAYYV